ncbi:MAG: hypothetical protein Alpg2KO_07510 [Alphaproteobacteria bacterium]
MLFALLIPFGVHADQAKNVPTAAPVPDGIAGLYCGRISSSGAEQHSFTRFVISPDGLMGEYGFADPTTRGEITFGTLENCTMIGDLIVSCLWRDAYGVGRFEVEFTKDYKRFFGHWGPQVTSTDRSLRWNGTEVEQADRHAACFGWM